jgi:hypothetical protein
LPLALQIFADFADPIIESDYPFFLCFCLFQKFVKLVNCWACLVPSNSFIIPPSSNQSKRFKGRNPVSLTWADPGKEQA